MTEEGDDGRRRRSPREVVLLRIYCSERDRWQREPLRKAILDCARSFGVARAAALWGIEGFGRPRKVYNTRILRLSYNLPVVVEIADRPERIRELSEKLRPMVERQLVTWETLMTVSGTESNR